MKRPPCAGRPGRPHVRPVRLTPMQGRGRPGHGGLASLTDSQALGQGHRAGLWPLPTRGAVTAASLWLELLDTLLGFSSPARPGLPGPCRVPPTSTGQRGSLSRRPLGVWDEKSDGPCQPAGVSALALCPAPRKGTERPAPAHSGAPGSPWAGGDKSGWHLPGMQGGCRPGKGDAAHAGEPSQPGCRPRAALLRSAPSAPALAAVLVQRRARARVCACACACVRLCAAGSLQHLCTDTRSSLSPAPLTGWLGLSLQTRPGPSLPQPPCFTSFASRV